MSSFKCIDVVKAAVAKEIPEAQTFCSSGSLVDGVLNMGAPAPIDVRITGNDVTADFNLAQKNSAANSRYSLRRRRVYPAGYRHPSLRISVDRTRASELGLTEKEVI
jgi:hypothetical protein